MALYAEPVVGYRAWVREEDSPRLRSFTKSWYWKPGLNEASCHPPVVQAAAGRVACRGPWPNDQCDCGLYAYRRSATPMREAGLAVGIVAAWGDLIVHDHQFRAQYAVVCGLLRPPARTAFRGSFLEDRRVPIELTAELYGVPVFETPDELEEWAAACGRSLVD